MKVLEIEIAGFRGIRQLTLKPNGASFAVLGDNGTGKSGVVDAIDFLLTGHIARLEGEGTQGISLREHGPHIDMNPPDARVTATVRTANHAQSAQFTRCVGSPSEVTVGGEGYDEVAAVLDAARMGQFVLSRREILKFITSQAADRAKGINQLLSLDAIEDVRKSLTTAVNSLKSAHKNSNDAHRKAEQKLADAIGQASLKRGDLLAAINKQRETLKGEPLSDPTPGAVRAGLDEPSRPKDALPNPEILGNNLEALGRLFSQTELDARAKAARRLVANLLALSNDPLLNRRAQLLNLAQTGIELVDDTGVCPLCDKLWPDGELVQYLETKILDAKKATDLLGKVETDAAVIRRNAERIAWLLETINPNLQSLGVLGADTGWVRWMDTVKTTAKALAEPTVPQSITRLVSADLTLSDTMEDVVTNLNRVREVVASAVPKPSPEITAWDTLHDVEERWKDLVECEDDLAKKKAAQTRGQILLATYVSTRDHVLSELYASIRDRFVELYCTIHGASGDNETDFSAVLKPEQAGLTLGVDFHGRGIHPPHALHSEGHQDSMGLCLYLALQERLSGGLIDIVVLDDVVMSVDAGHRRRVCTMLKTNFPNQQFCITTHDVVWARQLVSEHVVDRRNRYDFYAWSIDAGPAIMLGTDMWDQIDDDLRKGRVPDAAFSLRRGLEEYFRRTAAALRAQITYNDEEMWGLGQFMNASIGALNSYLKKGKNSASRHRNQQVLEILTTRERQFSTAATEANAEQWGINSTVHYNELVAMSKADFVPIVNAMKTLCEQFQCPECESLLVAEGTGVTVNTIRCECNRVNIDVKQ